MGFMTLEDFKAEISLDFSGRNPDPARLERWINFALYDLASREKFEELRVSASFPIVDGTTSYAIPTGFLGVISIKSKGRLLRKTKRLPIGDGTGNVRTGQPIYWHREGNNIIIWPEPDQNYDAIIEYIKEPTKLSASTDLSPFPAFYDVALVYLACFHGFMALGEKDEAFARLNTATEYLERRIDDGNIEADVAKEGLQVARSWEDLTEDPPHI